MSKGRTCALALAVATLLSFGPPGEPSWSEFVAAQYDILGVNVTNWVDFQEFDDRYAPVARWTNLGGGTNLDFWYNATPRLNGYGRNRVAIHDAKPNTVGWFIIGDARLDQDLLGIGANIIPTLTKVVQVTTDADGIAWLYLPLDLGFEETAYFQYWTYDPIGWVGSNGLELHTNLPLPEKRSSPTPTGSPPGMLPGSPGKSL